MKRLSSGTSEASVTSVAHVRKHFGAEPVEKPSPSQYRGSEQINSKYCSHGYLSPWHYPYNNLTFRLAEQNSCSPVKKKKRKISVIIERLFECKNLREGGMEGGRQGGKKTKKQRLRIFGSHFLI